MPFGLCNDPATFKRLMETVLQELTWKTCLVYLDDITIMEKHSRTPAKHRRNLQKVPGSKFQI